MKEHVRRVFKKFKCFSYTEFDEFIEFEKNKFEEIGCVLADEFRGHLFDVRSLMAVGSVEGA
jgi:hypothetical protein